MIRHPYRLMIVACALMGVSAFARAEKACQKCAGGQEEAPVELKSVQGELCKLTGVTYFCLDGGTGVFSLDGDEGNAWFDYQGVSYNRELHYDCCATIDGKKYAVYRTDRPAGTSIPRIRSFIFQTTPNADGSYNIYQSWRPNPCGTEPSQVFPFCTAARFRLVKE